MTIVATTWFDTTTRTPENNCHAVIACEVDGRRFEARSRRGAPERLARELVAAGVVDQPLEVRDTAGRLLITHRSLATAAQFTYAESRSMPVRRGRYVDISDRIPDPE